ncbi:hypothetical protein PoB_006775800 [Plakobranchus ocellatus]|uniref:C2 domain-containing protein n=1 Tax=Plakobranchus ocellatus TaxID=259542 RepID=A0AAV4DAM3_9GAST|nr:hypothetical protein PoB_006775800 [Plakobranchus ocellatus]
MSRKIKTLPKVPPAAEKQKQQAPTDACPFNQMWINSCYQQTLLPNAPWHKLEDEISHNLAQKAEKQFGHPQRKEMLMEVLGKHFVEKYLSHVQRNPEHLEASHMSSEERNRLRIDAQNWLNSQMYKAVKETGHGYLLTGMHPHEPPPTGTYADFLRDTFSVFTTGLDRELYIQEQNLTKSKLDELRHLKKSGKPDIYKVPAPSRLKPIDTASSAASQSTVKPSSSQMRTMIHTVEGDPPPLWGPQSDAIGAAVVSLLQRDPRKFDIVVGKIHGRQLPGSLRAYIWADVLFKAERKKMKEVFVEKIVRERFAVTMSRGLTELRIKKPTQSPINGLIQNAVIETYSKTTSMVPYKHMEHMKEAIRALNVLYVYDRSYEPYLVQWLFPMQLAFRDKEAMSDDRGEHVIELAMYLDMLNSNCFPSWPHVFAMAEQVMAILQQRDPALHDHLKRIAPINAQVNPKEFLVQLLHQERERAEAILQSSTTATPRAPSSSTQFLADPTIFLRRWIGEGFVSVLDTPGVMYVWDQLFMQQWQQSAIVNVCLSLMELLRHCFMEAYDYVTMKEVFLLEPCKLYTVDFQMAWIHTENGKNVVDINDLYNRQRPLSPASRMSIASDGGDTTLGGLLKPCGIKNIRCSLTIPSDSLQKEQWLALGVQPEDLRLSIALYFGSIKMRTRVCHSLPEIADSRRDSYGQLLAQLEFTEERHIYDMLDLSQYDVERELGAYPYAIFKLERMVPRSGNLYDRTPITLAWARIPLYRQSNTREGDSTFALVEGDTTVPLHPGDIPDSFITAQPRTPTEEELAQGSLLGYNCTLSSLVFDPNNEPPTRHVDPPQRDSPLPVQVPPIDTRPAETHRSPAPPTPAPLPPPVQPPPPRQETPEDAEPWVPHKPSAAKQNPKPSTNRDPFVLYVDAVRYLPDNASIVKVTGRILRAGDITNLQDILALPNLNGSSRSPSFTFRMEVNSGGQLADPDLLLFLRVYTYDVESRAVVVVGSCLVPVFTAGRKKGEGLLNVGGHQLRLSSGMPVMRDSLGLIGAADLDSNPKLPGCSLLIRLLPLTQDSIPAPAYATGYYMSEKCQPTTSETCIFRSYMADQKTFPKTERDMIRRLQQFEKTTNPGNSDADLTSWLVNKLDIKKQALNQPAGNLALPRCVRYRVKVGLRTQISAAFGLPDGLYIQCFVRVAAGKQAHYISPSDEGYGKEEQFITKSLQLDSQLTHPVWDDAPTEMRPYYDLHSCLIIQLIGLKVLYRPQADHKKPGTLHKPDGTPLEISDGEIIGWTAVPLFDGNSVLSGTHTVPVLTRPLTEEIREELSEKTVGEVLRHSIWNNYTKMPGASLQVKLWDAHFDFKELPESTDHRDLLEAVGDAEEYSLAAAAGAASSATQQEKVLSMLEEKVRKQGLKGTTFKKEMVFFQQAMATCMDNMMTDFCLRNGLPPL